MDRRGWLLPWWDEEMGGYPKPYRQSFAGWMEIQKTRSSARKFSQRSVLWGQKAKANRRRQWSKIEWPYSIIFFFVFGLQVIAAAKAFVNHFTNPDASFRNCATFAQYRMLGKIYKHEHWTPLFCSNPPMNVIKFLHSRVSTRLIFQGIPCYFDTFKHHMIGWLHKAYEYKQRYQIGKRWHILPLD